MTDSISKQSPALKHPNLVSIEKIDLNDQIKAEFLENDGPNFLKNAEDNAQHINVYRLIYLSAAPNSAPLKIKGFLIEPKNISHKLPVIIYNRGGSENFGAIGAGHLFGKMARLAREGYLVIASQYRGCGQSEGKETWGGDDLYDIINLKEIIDHHPLADTDKIGVWGFSRGGMMTYLLMKKVNWLKAAITQAGLADLDDNFRRRPDLQEYLSEFFDHTLEQKNLRSAIKWPELFPKNVPLLIMHGTADWRVHPSQSLNLSQKLLEYQVPHRLIMFEGGDHSLSEFKQESFQQAKKWFERFLKNSEPLPNLEPHGD